MLLPCYSHARQISCSAACIIGALRVRLLTAAAYAMRAPVDMTYWPPVIKKSRQYTISPLEEV